MINTLSKNERERVNMATVDYSPIDNDTQTRHAVDLTRVVDKVTTDKFELDDNNPNYIDINKCVKLDVQYGNVAATIESEYYGGQTDMVASAKFMVPLGTPWAKERVNIATAFPLFPQWVKDETNDDGIVNYPFWEEANRAAATNFYWDPNYDLAEIQGLDPAIWSKGKFITNNGTTYAKSSETITPLDDIIGSSTSEVDPLNPIFTIPDNQTETILYDFTIPTVGPGYLYDGNQVTVASDTQITTGSKIRIYGVSTEGWEVTFDDQTKSASNGGRYSTNGYIEFDVTSNIGKRLQITGKNFTITYVTLVSGNNDSGAKTGQIWPKDKDAGAEGSVALSSSLFEGITADANKKLCVYVGSTAGNYFQFYLNGWPSFNSLDSFVTPSNWTIDNQVLRPGNGAYNNNRFEMPLNSSILKYIKSQGGCGFQSNYTITNITIE